jgi:hypothetical protein
MHGPYGIVLQFRNIDKQPDVEIERETIETHQFIKSLPGFRSVMYFNIDEEFYTAAISFDTEEAVDNALAQVGPIVAAKRPHATVSKAELVPGELVDYEMANPGSLQR